jgi:maltooligosyltrehalose trehalohydrolase
VGNRARGDRLSALVAPPAKQRLAAGLLLLSPYLPLIFMGEEYGEENPFPFFSGFRNEELVEAVRIGRREEFRGFGWPGEIPDPASEDTFESARLSWSWPEGTHRAGLRRMYRDLLTARREWPALRDFVRRSARLLEDGEESPVLELVRGTQATGGSIRAVFNLGGRPQHLHLPDGGGTSATTAMGTATATTTTVLFSSEAARYGGSRREAGGIAELLPFECVVFGPVSFRAFPRKDETQVDRR